MKKLKGNDKMPNAGIHLCIARRLAKKVNMDKYLFYVGNIAPDSWRNSSSTRRISPTTTQYSSIYSVSQSVNFIGKIDALGNVCKTIHATCVQCPFESCVFQSHDTIFTHAISSIYQS